MLRNFNGSCQGTSGAPTNTPIYSPIHTHTHPNIHTFVSQKRVILHFFLTQVVHERSDFLRVTQPFNTSGPANVRRRGNLYATLKQRAREKHSWGRLKPKQRKEEEIHLFSKGGNIRRPLLPCVLAGRAEPLDYVMLTEQANDGCCAKQVSSTRKRGWLWPPGQTVEIRWGTGEAERFTVALLADCNNSHVSLLFII